MLFERICNSICNIPFLFFLLTFITTSVCEMRLIWAACMKSFWKMPISSLSKCKLFLFFSAPSRYLNEFRHFQDADKTQEICLDLGLQWCWNHSVCYEPSAGIDSGCLVFRCVPPVWLLACRPGFCYSLSGMTVAVALFSFFFLLFTSARHYCSQHKAESVKQHHLVLLFLSDVAIYLLPLFCNDLFHGSVSLKSNCGAVDVHWIQN